MKIDISELGFDECFESGVFKKIVYICDGCRAVALEKHYSLFGCSWAGLPEGWKKLDDKNLCPVCYAAQKQEDKQNV